jgi:hypothetical protein
VIPTNNEESGLAEYAPLVCASLAPVPARSILMTADDKSQDRTRERLNALILNRCYFSHKARYDAMAHPDFLPAVASKPIIS